ncbi:MAG: polyphenol oxidase family protein [Proteobacteria bacterium]|nr:polyphenol oxidase family protein [Pseudomonadota bacterium]MBU1738343.1 polyphenol oxidase family protein [Pseudomonadota bacterium]
MQFSSLSESGLTHGVFSRHGGVSPSPFRSLNTSYGVGDSEANVAANRQRFKEALGVGTLVSAVQVHGGKVLDVTEEPEGDLEVAGYDALITRCNIGLMIQQADCQAVLFFAPDRRVIGIAHAGWKGSVVGILGETVALMVENYGVDSARIKAAISPSLGACCAEFVNYRQELPGWMHGYQVAPNYFDFQAISRAQLVEAGLAKENISAAPICTRCSPDYFSYRRTKTTGRFASVIGLACGS